MSENNLLDDIEESVDKLFLDEQEEKKEFPSFGKWIDSKEYFKECALRDQDFDNMYQQQYVRKIEEEIRRKQEELEDRYMMHNKHYDSTIVMCHKCNSKIKVKYSVDKIDSWDSSIATKPAMISVKRDKFHCPCCGILYNIYGNVIGIEYSTKFN